MKGMVKKAMVAGAALGAVFAWPPSGRSAQSQPAKPEAVRTNDQAFKNIQVLKGLPSDQLIPAMQFISASLGVQCEFCHVQDAFDKDDKKPKQTARKMMQMMFAINKDNFESRREVTCYSCHRGSPHPVATPIITGEAPKPAVEATETIPGDEAKAAKLPTADQVLDKYIRAAGGAEAIQKISSLVEKGTVSFGGHQFSFEVFSKSPDKRSSIMHLTNGDSVTTYDGHEGWLGAPRHPVREMGSSDLDAVRLDADLHFPIDLKQIFGELSVERTEKLGDREAYVISALRSDLPPVELYFDAQTGLLVRQVRYAESPLGRNPTQIDYADYRDSGGAKIPFRWTIARPGGLFTIQLDQVQRNVPIDDSKFAKPAGSAPPEEKPPSP